MRQRTASVICLLVIGLLFTSCNQGKSSDSTFTPVSSSTATNAPTPEATPTPVAEVPIKTLCLQIDDSEFHYSDLERIEEDLVRILNLADLGVGFDPFATCDATLLISLEGSPLSDYYEELPKTNKVRCFTGASVHGEMILQQPDRAPRVIPISGRKPTVQGTITTCPSAIDAPFYGITMASLLHGLDIFWGAEMLVYAQAIVQTGQAMAALREKNPQQVVPEIISLLDTHPDASVRLAALDALTEIGGSVGETLPAIRRSLRDEDPAVREMAMEVLTILEPDAPEVVERSNVERILGELEDSDDETVRIEAIKLLGQMGGHENVIQALISVLEDSDESDQVREAVAASLANIGPATVPWLIEALEEGNQSAVAGSALALEKLGGDSEPAVPALIDCITTQFGYSAYSGCRSALSAIGPAVVKPLVDYTLTQAECDGNFADTLNGLAQSYPEIKETVPYLIDCLEIHPNSVSFYQALRFFTGEDFGEDVTAWREWWLENR